MSENEFLARWSRRKRQATANVPAENAEPGEEQAPPPTSATKEGEPELDLSSLPPIDSITATTDITAFLRKGIPWELRHAALRRAWAADPTIRDFVGLAENAWDFNDPTAMPGFGPLDCSTEELAALVDRIVGTVRKAVELPPVETGDPADPSPELREAEGSTAPDVTDQACAVEQPAPVPAAAQPNLAWIPDEDIEPDWRPRHGGALPR
jgi:hypothetical protein